MKTLFCRMGLHRWKDVVRATGDWWGHMVVGHQCSRCHKRGVPEATYFGYD